MLGGSWWCSAVAGGASAVLGYSSGRRGAGPCAPYVLRSLGGGGWRWPVRGARRAAAAERAAVGPPR